MGGEARSAQEGEEIGQEDKQEADDEGTPWARKCENGVA
jgi:hypothetical protein